MPRISYWVLAFAIGHCIGCASAPPEPIAIAHRSASGLAPEPMVIAHRGASGLAPEHTLAAYDLAIELGAHTLEQDLQMTRDGVLVILHDETLDRTARGPAENCTGPVHEKTLAELGTCDFGVWFDDRVPGAGARFAGQKIVTLEALIQRYGTRVLYYIETKHPEHAPGVEQALLSMLAIHELLPREGEEPHVIVQSFSSESLRNIHALQPDLPLVQLLEDDLDEPLDDEFGAIAEYAVGIGPPRSQVDSTLMAAARRHGLVVHPYTVNERAEMTRLLDLGVDGLFTDRPDRLVELLRQP